MSIAMDPRLREILVCPCPRNAPLRDGLPTDPDADYLTCQSCGRSFPVRDGIPVLLLQEAIGGPEADTPSEGPGKG
ncbi:Trm112 family protein [Actinopolyspora mortivallis]|uniref:Trm112 family protein n=1 Tax=Actinopolyspora mortivallis TaxID=33906 RepID=UPI000363D31E|nr:Trm112 family protein [Actinopolyspora mortivallis]